MFKYLLRSERTRVLIVFIALLIFKISLLGEGYLEDTDEMPFIALLDNFDKLIRFDAEAWNYQIYMMWSNYIETFIRLTQAYFLQFYADMINVPTSSTQAMHLMGGFNLVVNLLISIFQYKILRRLNFSKGVAIMGTLLVAALLNSNLYIRHILPYESSLLFHFISIFILAGNNLTYRKVFLAGWFCALGFFNYYGNFPMLLIAGGFMLMRALKGELNKNSFANSKFKSLFASTTLLALPTIIALIILEAISLKNGASYISFLKLFSTTIFHGTPEEALGYIYTYFGLVEKYWGQTLLFLSTVAIFYAIFYKQVISSNAKGLFLIAVFVYILYGLQGVLTKEMVFYGRILHLFYFFMIIGVLLMASAYPKIRLFLWIGAFANIVFVYNELNSMGFPRSTIYKMGLFDEEDNYIFVNELKVGVNYNYKERFLSDEIDGVKQMYLSPVESKNKNKLLLKNFAFFFHYPDEFIQSYKEFPTDDNMELVYSKTHFMSHPAYTFEYCTKDGREFFLEKKLMLQVFKLN